MSNYRRIYYDEWDVRVIVEHLVQTICFAKNAKIQL